MRLGSSFQILDIGADPGALRAFAQGLEGLGFDDLYLGEHILGADLSSRPSWAPFNQLAGGPAPPAYDESCPFFETMVTFGFLAENTRQLGLISGIMVLSMRQTVLVAKQAAVADILSEGRITLGIGAGWNDVEFEAMGVDFSTRGARIDEQISVLRQLWTQETVNYAGRFHNLRGVGINPLPVQRPIPIWVGGSSEAAMRRAVRLSDAWYPSLFSVKEDKEEKIARFWELVEREPGNSPALVGTINQAWREDDVIVDELVRWEELGAQRVDIRTSDRSSSSAGASGPPPIVNVDSHLERLRQIREAWLRSRPRSQ